MVQRGKVFQVKEQGEQTLGGRKVKRAFRDGEKLRCPEQAGDHGRWVWKVDWCPDWEGLECQGEGVYVNPTRGQFPLSRKGIGSSKAVWENFMENLRNGFWGPSSRLPFLATGSPGANFHVPLALQDRWLVSSGTGDTGCPCLPRPSLGCLEVLAKNNPDPCPLQPTPHTTGRGPF